MQTPCQSHSEEGSERRKAIHDQRPLNAGSTPAGASEKLLKGSAFSQINSNLRAGERPVFILAPRGVETLPRGNLYITDPQGAVRGQTLGSTNSLVEQCECSGVLEERPVGPPVQSGRGAFCVLRFVPFTPARLHIGAVPFFIDQELL